MSDVGFALMVAAIFGGITGIISGELCDRFGRKIMMNIGLFMQIIAFIFLAYAVNMNASYEIFLGLLTFREVAGSFYRNVPSVMVADVARVGERMEAFSMLRIGGNLGFAVGPIFGGILAMYSYSALFLVTAITSGIYMLISIFMLRDTMPRAFEKTDASHVSPWLDRPFLVYCIVSAVISLVYAQMLTTYGTYSGSYAGVPESHIGLLFSLNGFMVVFLQYPVAKYLQHFRLTTSLAGGALLYAIGFGIVGFCYDFWSLFIAMFMISAGELVMTPASMTIVAQMASPDMRGRYMSVSGVLGGAGMAFGPMVGGYLMDMYSARIEMMWLILGGLALICILGFVYLRLRVSFDIDKPTTA
jgi:MFS family permease